MNTIYVLIMIINGTQGAAAIHTQEFTSKTACLTAREAFLNMNPSYLRDFGAICVKK